MAIPIVFRNIREIAAPACALARNDTAFLHSKGRYTLPFFLQHENFSEGLKPEEEFATIEKMTKGGLSVNQKADFIGVFDSGVGGISVLRQLKKLMPNERFLYFGDSANAPYGNRTTQEVLELTMDATEKMVAYGLKALVIACNTATAAAIQTLRETYQDLIVIGIEPALKPAVDQFPNGTIGIMATEVTLREEKLDKLLHRYAQGASIVKIPAPGLVELIEAGKTDEAEMQQLLTELLQPYIGKLDAMVLGCTHYPLAASALRKVLGPRVVLLDGGEGTARETKRRLEQENLLFPGPGEVVWHSSAKEKEFMTLAQNLLNQR